MAAACMACCVLQLGVPRSVLASGADSRLRAQTTSLSYRVPLSCLPGVEPEVLFHLVGIDSLIGYRLKKVDHFIHIDGDQGLGIDRFLFPSSRQIFCGEIYSAACLE